MHKTLIMLQYQAIWCSRHTSSPLIDVRIIMGREIDTEHYNGSILRIYKVRVVTITHLYNNGFLLIALVYALVNI